jgi:hypothetical protein
MVAAFVCVLLSCVTSAVLADDIRPAYLGVENNKPDRFYVTWKNPLLNGAPLPIEPIFPEGFKRITPITMVKTSDSIVRKWTLSSEGQSLEDKTIVIAGLPATTSDVLFRVKFLDDKIFRTVIKPNTEPPEPLLYSAVRRIDSGRLIVLLVAVGLLGALPASRKKGVVLCSAALIIGASFGYVAGQIPVGEYFAAKAAPSEEKTRQILRGLLLNVYRSFSYGYDEAVYDQMAKSVSGDLLATVYLQARNAMQVDEDGGKAQAFVDRLDIRELDSITKTDGEGFSVVASWDVYGSVNHWEHIHYRCNAYQAKLTLIPEGKYWKITGFELLDEKRIL